MKPDGGIETTKALESVARLSVNVSVAASVGRGHLADLGQCAAGS